MLRYARVDGALVEPVGHLWVAFSPATGETALLNDESAAILEILQTCPADTGQVCVQLSADSGIASTELAPVVEESWASLIDAGLVRVLLEPATIAG